MSMVRVITRIIPNISSQDNISAILSSSQADEPMRTMPDSGVGPVRTETTFCRAVPISPDCIDVDREVSKGCEGINGLVGLKKSRLKVVTETQLATEVTSGFRVTPEIGPDGSCSGMLLSIPLTIPRSKILGESGNVRTSNSGENTNHERTDVGDLASMVAREGTIDDHVLLRSENQNHQSTVVSSRTPRGEETKSDSRPGTEQESILYSDNVGADSNEEVNQGPCPDPHLTNGDSVLTVLTTTAERNELSTLKKTACPLRFKKDQFICDLCGKKFLGKRHLVLHSRRAHSGVPCPLCKALFPSGKHIKDHMDEAHAGQLPHNCTVCGARFLTAETLRDHERQHRKKERRNRCEMCGKGFAHEKLLQSHMAGVHFSEGFC